jgi:hypothetical protein
MLTSILAFFFPIVSYEHTSDDIYLMERAFLLACEQYPYETDTDEQREQLANAILAFYQRGLTENDLVALIFRTLH